MGLITTLLSTVVGYRFTFMTPAAFVRRPSRWIRELARKEGETGGVFSAAPNFAFEHAALRGLPKDGEPPLDLSNVKAILNGSEPVSAASIRKFNDAFGPYGFQEKAIKPSYGLAEATLFVSTTPMEEPPTIIHVDREALNTGPVRRSGRRCAERRRAGLRRQDRCQRVGDHRRPRNRHRIARRADRRGLAARQQHGRRLLEPRSRRPTRRSGTSSSRAPTRHAPRVLPTTGRGCAPVTTAPTTTITSTSPAGSRIWSSSTDVTTTRRISSTRRRNPAGPCARATWPPSRCRPTSCPPRFSTTRTPG